MRRIVLVASDAAAHPAGTITAVCRSSAAAEGAFRFMENDAVRPQAIRECVQSATLRRVAGETRVFVPIDATSLQITDEKRTKGLGAIGATHKEARGLHVMTALAVTEAGAPVGIVAQHDWIRSSPSKRTHRDHRKAGGESKHWVEALAACQAQFEGTGVQPWAQLDRGGDCWQVHSYAADNELLVTIRATHDRKLDAELDYLSEALEAAPVVAKRKIAVPARGPRKRLKRVGGRKRIKDVIAAHRARSARVEIRAARVDIVLPTSDDAVTYNAVFVRETGRAKNALSWVLLTTHPIASRKDVLEVVRGYTLRWRIEEFHRTWKTGLCRVEDTQLRSRNAIVKWATILASVATRAMRLTHSARTNPNAPASSEFTEFELEALLTLRQPKSPIEGELPLHLAIRWVAELGGYIRPWNGPPGATTIARGLADLLIAAQVLELIAKQKRERKPRRPSKK